MSATSSLASVVIIAKSPNPFARSRLLPVLPDAGDAERRAILHSDRIRLLRRLTLDAFHSKKPSTGTMQRRLRYASRNVGKSCTVSNLALIGLRPPFGSLH